MEFVRPVLIQLATIGIRGVGAMPVYLYELFVNALRNVIWKNASAAG